MFFAKKIQKKTWILEGSGSWKYNLYFSLAEGAKKMMSSQVIFYHGVVNTIHFWESKFFYKFYLICLNLILVVRCKIQC